MRTPRRVVSLAVAVSLAVPLAAVTSSSVKAVQPQSGPYVRDSFTLTGGTGSVLDVATLDDDSVFVASSLSNGTGVVDVIDNPGDNNPIDDDSLALPSGVLGVAANQVDDTAYFVTNSFSVPPGVVWTARTSAADNAWSSVTWGGPAGQEKFVAVAGNGTGNGVMTSPDGITWTTQASAADNAWYSVTWGGPAGQEKFVAVAYTGTGTGNRVMTSPNGITWTTQTSPADLGWRSVTWGGPAGQKKFVAVAYFGTGTSIRVMTSPDGITWTTQTSPVVLGWSSVTWGGPAGQKQFVAVPYGAVAGNGVMTSPDGITWTTRTSAANNAWQFVTWGGPAGQEKFVAVAGNGTGNRVMTSAAPPWSRAALWSYAGGALDDSAPLPGTGVGGAWADVAVNDGDDTVYVASQDDTRIIAFRGSNLDDSRSIALPAGTTPYALAVNQTDDTVYVLSYGSGFNSYLTALHGANPDDSTTVALNMVPGRQALSISPIDGTVYVGGWATLGKVEAYTPTLVYSDSAVIGMGLTATGLAVSDDGRRLYVTADDGSAYLFNTANFTDTASVPLGVTAPGAVAVDDYGWAWTGSPSTSTGSRSVVQIGTAPTFTSITPASGPTAGGTATTITGNWFTPTTTAAFGTEANVGTAIGTPTSNSLTVAVPPGPAGAADLILVNVAGPSQPLGVNTTGSFTYASAPPSPIPPSAPGNVTAHAGDASALVTWAAPTAPGSYPVTTYQVTSTPSEKTCMTSTLNCTVPGLTNGTSYTFTVKALNGVGWGANSNPSNAVTPTAAPTPSITITGSRDGQRITVTGTSMHVASQTVRPWFKYAGQTSYTEGAAVIEVKADGTFTWSRKSNKKTYVYVAHGTTRSNTVTIPAR